MNIFGQEEDEYLDDEEYYEDEYDEEKDLGDIQVLLYYLSIQLPILHLFQLSRKLSIFEI